MFQTRRNVFVFILLAGVTGAITLKILKFLISFYMAFLLTSIEQTILSWRSDTLTPFFKIFPFIAGPYFYLIMIPMGYWASAQKRLFTELAMLIPYATLINALIKNFYRIPRPQNPAHLIVVTDPYGFPSGDMQVATVFWGLVFLKVRSSYARLLCLLPLLGIGLSRIYLGVHRLQEVVVGFLIGVSLLLLWEAIGRNMIWQQSPRNYLILVLSTLACYILVSYDLLI